MGKNWATGDAGVFPTKTNRTAYAQPGGPLLPTIPEGFSPPWDPCPSVCEGGVHCFETLPWQRFFAMAHIFAAMAPCTRPCTRWCLVHGFAQFSMARAQFRPRRASGIFFPCGRSWPCTCPWTSRPVFCSCTPPCMSRCIEHGFCLVFPVSRPDSSTTGVGHFPRVPFFPRVLVHGRVGASYMVLPCFAWRASSFVHGGSRALCYRVLCSRVPVLNAFGMCTHPPALSGDHVCHTRDFAISLAPNLEMTLRMNRPCILVTWHIVVLSGLAIGLIE